MRLMLSFDVRHDCLADYISGISGPLIPNTMFLQLSLFCSLNIVIIRL